MIINQEKNPFPENLENILFDEKPLLYPHLITFSAPKSEEYDFYDELGELSTSSSFTGFMRGKAM
ncbi:hypothetical protein RJ640_012598 [Escallonia rubra]|uniref:Uncharacterized protein n=1 Tax=Escallonia rubra TaxID=112253 RepID=A0AA88SBG8_9ASTE|nr:hypothetical protein RJ640_012598 [Escallonia rubra]